MGMDSSQLAVNTVVRPWLLRGSAVLPSSTDGQTMAQPWANYALPGNPAPSGHLTMRIPFRSQQAQKKSGTSNGKGRIKQYIWLEYVGWMVLKFMHS